MQWLQARTQPGESFFNDDAVEFYLKLKNPTHVEFVNNDAFTSPQDVARIIAAMQKTPPRYVEMLPGIPETPYDHAGPFRSTCTRITALRIRFWCLSENSPKRFGGAAANTENFWPGQSLLKKFLYKQKLLTILHV